ncbi:MAG: hypothetical protein GY773_00715 [Actinomycetia bacterium]|nr:hypothetical protein [Actinomycetes bacterium]
MLLVSQLGSQVFADEGWLGTHARAQVFAAWLGEQTYDLILTGVQAADDLDGQLVPLLGAMTGMPHASVVVAVEAGDGVAKIRQEFAAGATADLEIQLPAIIGVQAARQEPRYAPIAKIRQAQQAGQLVEHEVEPARGSAGLTIRRMYTPEVTGHAEMLEGDEDDVAARIIELVRQRGLLTS